MPNDLTLTRLLYYFWLPAGKDEFGFQDQETAPLGRSASYRDHGHVEQTIAKRLVEQAKKLQGTQPDLSHLTWRGRLTPTDADLGLQKVQFEFTYKKMKKSLPLLKVETLTGNGMLLSNGLYLWSFDLHHDPGISEHRLWVESEEFLKDDFIRSHIHELFTFNWSVPKILDSYNGVMTYYQLDVLFNGIFDHNALPHSFFNKGGAGWGNDVYEVGNIIKSLSLASIRNSHRPLYDAYRDFSLPEAYERQHRIDTNIDLFAPHRTEDEQLSAEMLLSRLSCAAMEQFLHVAISFGITHYKSGLDYCRGQLTDISLLTRANQTSADLSRPSLSQETPRLADLESYHSVLVGKVPTLQFLQDLIKGLSEASRPLKSPPAANDTSTHNGANGNGWTEWTYSRSELDEALLQFEWQTNAIKSDLWAIDQSLKVTRVDQILAELSETRKLTEIEAETPRQIFIRRSPEEGRELDRRLGLIALLLAVMEVYGNFGVFLTQSFFTGRFFGAGSSTFFKVLGWTHWIIVIVILSLVYMLFLRRRGSRREATDGNQANGRARSFIFDYSAMREKVNVAGGSQTVIDQLAGDLKAIEDPAQSVACVGKTLSRDTPFMGIERTKHTIESGESKARISYTLHIEIDRRWVDNRGDRDEQLRDIRLVVRVPEGVGVDITRGSQQLIQRCMGSLILVGREDKYVREFMEKRFGWR